jgi:hypothetical protein
MHDYTCAQSLDVVYIASLQRFTFEEGEKNTGDVEQGLMNMIKRKHIFEGTLVAAKWDRLDNVSQSSLCTIDDDILLEHVLGINKFKPYLNHKVKIWGDASSDLQGEKKIQVKKIIRIEGHQHGFRGDQSLDQVNLIIPTGGS